MKKFLAAAFVGILITSSLTGCGKKNETEDNSTNVEATTFDNNPEGETEIGSESVIGGSDGPTKIVIENPEGDKNAEANNNNKPTTTPPPVEMVDIYFPAEAFNGASEESIKGDAATMGATAVVNDDGSVIYTMSKENQTEILTGLKESLINQSAKLAKNEKYPFIKDISLNDNLTEVTVKLDKAEFEAQGDSISFRVFADNCRGYQTFNNVKTENLKVVIHFIDASNNTEFKTETYDKDGLVE